MTSKTLYQHKRQNGQSPRQYLINQTRSVITKWETELAKCNGTERAEDIEEYISKPFLVAHQVIRQLQNENPVSGKNFETAVIEYFHTCLKSENARKRFISDVLK